MSTETSNPGFRYERFARIREAVIDVMIPAQKKHNIHLLFEADVTDVRRHLERQKTETGEVLSFTAFLIKSTADAAMINPRLTARRTTPRRLVVFDDVHVNCMVEAAVDGQSHPVGTIIQRANSKGVGEIHDQLNDFGDTQRHEQLDLIRKFVVLPRFLRSMLLSATAKRPQMIMKRTGTAILTSVGMFGAGGGHVIPFQDFTLCVGVGGITRKPGIVEDRIEPREFLAVTATFDHNIIDGAPAARFAQELKSRIEAGHGLLDVRPPVSATSAPFSDLVRSRDNCVRSNGGDYGQ